MEQISSWEANSSLTGANMPYVLWRVIKRVRKVIINKEKWKVFEAWWRNVQKWRKVKSGEWSIVKWTEVKIFCEMCVLSHYSYVAVWRFCVVCCFIIICFPSYFVITLVMSVNILFMSFLVLYVCFLFYAFCVFVLCCVLFLSLCYLFPIFVQVYRPLSLDGNPTAVNK